MTRLLREMTCLTCGQVCSASQPHTCPPLPPRPIRQRGAQHLTRPQNTLKPQVIRADKNPDE